MWQSVLGVSHTAGVNAVTPWICGCHPQAGELSWFCASDGKPAQLCREGVQKWSFLKEKIKKK